MRVCTFKNEKSLHNITLELVTPVETCTTEIFANEFTKMNTEAINLLQVNDPNLSLHEANEISSMSCTQCGLPMLLLQ